MCKHYRSYDKTRGHDRPARMQAVRRERMRRLHLRTGVDEAYLRLPAGQSIWFVMLLLDTQVHVQGDGFTNMLHVHCMGVDAESAIDCAKRWMNAFSASIGVCRTSTVRALEQDPCLYTFPEQIKRADMPVIPARPSNTKPRGLDRPQPQPQPQRAAA